MSVNKQTIITKLPTATYLFNMTFTLSFYDQLAIPPASSLKIHTELQVFNLNLGCHIT